MSWKSVVHTFVEKTFLPGSIHEKYGSSLVDRTLCVETAANAQSTHTRTIIPFLEFPIWCLFALFTPALCLISFLIASLQAAYVEGMAAAATCRPINSCVASLRPSGRPMDAPSTATKSSAWRSSPRAAREPFWCTTTEPYRWTPTTLWLDTSLSTISELRFFHLLKL